MTPSSVDHLIDNWSINSERNCEFKGYQFTTEYLIVIRTEDNLFEVIQDRSSTVAGPWNKEQVIKLFSSDKLIIMSNQWVYSLKYHKSNGCSCGSFFTSEPNLHLRWCEKYKENQ